MIKQVCINDRWDPNSYDNTGSELEYEEVFDITQSCRIETSLSDCLSSVLIRSMGSYPSAEMQSVYSTAQTDWNDGKRLVFWFGFVLFYGI